MTKTTIQISKELRVKLVNERLPHESNYGDTIRRLLNDGSGGQLWTKQEIQDIVDRRIEEASRY